MIFKKLVHKLTILSIVPVIISMILFGSISYSIYKDQLIHQRMDEARSLILLSSEEMENPLYFVQLDKINAIIRNIKGNPNVNAVFVLDAEGKVITDGTYENRFYGQIFTDDFSERSIRSRESVIVIENNILKISSPVAINEKIGTIFIDFSLNELDAVLMNMMILLGAIGAIIVIIISGINFSISNSISKPVTELRDAANEIAKSNFNARIEKRSDDEIGELVGTFNKMAEDLQRSIEEQKKSEKMQIENEQLALASKAKSEFLANMSHELRTPLNSIIGFSELMEMNTSLDNKQKHYLENVLTSGKFLLNLINDILDLSKVEAGKIELVIEKIDVPSFLDETLTLIKEKASKNHLILKKDFDPTLSYIKADQQRLKQILFNLLSNAIKFSKPGGGTITITTKKEGDTAKFSVSDTGIGISDENMDKLFSEFEQLDSGITKKYGGTGLGLAITKKLIELHGGRITVESRYGEGSTFTFYLPIE